MLLLSLDCVSNLVVIIYHRELHFIHIRLSFLIISSYSYKRFTAPKLYSNLNVKIKLW